VDQSSYYVVFIDVLERLGTILVPTWGRRKDGIRDSGSIG